MQIRPLHDRVIIKRLAAETTTSFGIVIPDSAGEKPDQGEVIAVGPGKRDEAGRIIALDVKVGDRVLFGKYSGQTVKVDGKVYGGEIVYTGPLDELFNLDLGALPYRTLDMKFETLDMDQFQPVGTVNYTTSEDYTRITEFKNMTGQVLPGKTTIMKEYSKAYTPGSGETPYYAILEPENRELYERYLERVQNLTNFHPVGRLAEYRYYDMDAVTNSALDLSDEIIACHA